MSPVSYYEGETERGPHFPRCSVGRTASKQANEQERDGGAGDGGEKPQHFPPTDSGGISPRQTNVKRRGFAMSFRVITKCLITWTLL